MSNKNQYSHATRYFRIPVPGWKDRIWPELEVLKWQMVENMLMAAMRGNVNAVFREGDLRIKKDSNGTYSVKLSATGNDPSCHGTVGGAYFDAPTSLVWDGLKEGQAYYLYLKGCENTFQDSRDVATVSSVTRIQTRYVTLIAKADLTGDNPTVDRNPPGKVNSRDLAQHALDYDNPHGDKMAQDELLVRNHLAIGDGNDADLELDVNGEVSHFPVSRLVSALKTANFFVDFATAGNVGVTLTAPGRVLFASAVRTNPKSIMAGEVIIGFFGQNPDVKAPNQIIVWNSGEVGVEMRAMIICE